MPVLIFVFLTTMAAAGYFQAIAARERALHAAAHNLDLATALLEGQAAGGEIISAASGPPDALASLARLGMSGSFAIFDARGLLLADTANGDQGIIGALKDAFANEAVRRHAARVENIGAVPMLVARGEAGPWRVVALRDVDNALHNWRERVSFLVLFTTTTGVVLLILGFAFYWQASRATRADDIYNAVRARLETALTHGRGGLWDWDLEQGSMFWSDSMFLLLGFPPRDDLLTFEDVNELIHDGDGGLKGFAAFLASSVPGTVDRRFRMRNAHGEWIFMRARGELVIDPTTGRRRLIGIAMDETEVRRLAEHTQQADSRLKDAIEALSEAFVLWDADNRLVICNSRFQKLHRLPKELVEAGTHYSAIIENGCQPVVRTQLTPDAKLQRGGRTIEVQLDDGRWLTVNERRTKDGGYVSVGTDITSLKEQQERLMDGERRLMATIADLKRSRQVLELQAQELAELAEKYAEEKINAEAANRAKSEFLANMSHELRTPLNAIIGFSEIMETGTFGAIGDPRYIGYCRDILDSGHYLLDFVDDVLEMSKIEAGNVELRHDHFALDELLSDIVHRSRADIEAKNLTLHPAWPLDLEMEADRRALRLITRNLLSNAVKFTPEGGKIGLRVRRSAGKVAIFVEDSGIGIPSDAIPKLGRPFEQVQTQFTKAHRGSGLGLSIARSLAELHGGTLRIRSALSVGTVVMVILPTRQSMQADMPLELPRAMRLPQYVN